ncbi:MAG: chemotaxis protein CheW [Sphingobium sp.]
MAQIGSSHVHAPQARNCWSSIGVRGDKSCAALARYAHCRNCPTYSDIAAGLLTREAVVDSGEEWNERYAAPQHAAHRNDRSALVFRIGSEWFAIAIAMLDEVIDLRAIHRLPHRNNPVVLGVANVRGELVVCVSLDRLLGLPADAALGARTRRLLVLRSDSGRFAVPVDEVQHTHAYQQGEMIAPPATSTRSATSYTIGLISWRDRMISCLDEGKILDSFESCLA